jgi:rhomboid family GlyGly-CTERM serine protease
MTLATQAPAAIGEPAGADLSSFAARAPWLSLSLALLACIIFALGSSAAQLLQFDHSAIETGQLWRIITGHWTHWTSEHLLWDVAMFAALGAVCERRSRGRFLATVFLSAVVISVSILEVLPTMQLYRGLSGTDSALFALLAVWMIRRAPNEMRSFPVIPLLFIVGFFAKLLIELLTGNAVFVHSTDSFVPVPFAHLVGACVGAVVALIQPRSKLRG